MRSKAPALMPLLRSEHLARLLAEILLHPEEWFTLSQLANRLGIPLTTVQREIDRLSEIELVREERIGRSRSVSANPQNRYTESLTELVSLSFGPLPVLAEEFVQIGQVADVAIYGSWAARYVGEHGSLPNDVDVLIVGDASRTKVYQASDRVEQRLHLPVNPTLCTVSKWKEARDPLIQQIQKSPVVWVLREGRYAGESYTLESRQRDDR